MAVNSSASKCLVGLLCSLSIMLAGCRSSSTGTTNVPPTPPAAPIGNPAEVNRLRITLTDIEIMPDGRLRFWIYAQNWSPDARSLPLEYFVATDEATGMTYKADVSESRWIGNVEASYGGIGQITLDRPLPASAQSLRLSFSGMTDGNNIAIQGVSVTSANAPLLAQDLNLSSPFVDGLQLTVKRVEVSDGVVKVEVTARHIDIGLASFGPQLYGYGGADMRQEKAEVEAREWRNLQSTEFTFQDEYGRTYEVDGTRSEWDTEVIPNGSFAGFLTINQTLVPSVSQLRLIYADVYHSARVALTIDSIPVPQQGITTPLQLNTPLSECEFVTSSPQLTEQGRIEADLTRQRSVQYSGTTDIGNWLNYGREPTSVSTPIATPTSTPIPVTHEVFLQSNIVCGLTLSIQRVIRNEYGTVMLEMTVTNEDLPYRLSLRSLPVNVIDVQGRELKSSTSYVETDFLQNKDQNSMIVTLWQLPVDVTEINVSLTLPGKQVLVIEHVPLP